LLSSNREALSGEYSSVTKYAAEEQHHETNRARYAAAEYHNHGSQTIAAVLRASIRNPLADRAYGVFEMDRLGFMLLWPIIRGGRL